MTEYLEIGGHPMEKIEIGQQITAVVTELSVEKHRLAMSLREFKKQQQRKEMFQYMQDDEEPDRVSLGDLIKENHGFPTSDSPSGELVEGNVLGALCSGPPDGSSIPFVGGIQLDHRPTSFYRYSTSQGRLPHPGRSREE